MADLEAQLTAFGDRYGKLSFAVSVLNTALLVYVILVK